MATYFENFCVGSLDCILLCFLPRQSWGPWHLSSFFSLSIPFHPVCFSTNAVLLFYYFLKKLINLFIFSLKYCIGFAIHWHESTIGVHVRLKYEWAFHLSYPRFTPCPKVALITFLLVVFYFGHIGLIWGNILSILICQSVKWTSQVVKNLPASAVDIRDVGLTPGSGRSSGEGNGNLIQYSCLENPTDGGGGWQPISAGSLRVRHDWSDVTHTWWTSLYLGMISHFKNIFPSWKYYPGSIAFP